MGEDPPLRKHARAIDSSVRHKEGVHNLHLRRIPTNALRRHPDGPTLHVRTLFRPSPGYLCLQGLHIVLPLLPCRGAPRDNSACKPPI